MKKIWLLCLCLASLGLVGCFHIPDEDWLPSKNKVNTWNVQKDEEMEQALDSFVEWFNTLSSERDEIKNEEDNRITTKEWEENTIVLENEEIIDNEVEIEEIEDEVIEDNTVSE